jgi:GGDEF domain-containing protein
LVPIALGAWFVDMRAGLWLCGLSAAVRLQDLWLGPHHPGPPWTPYWNSLVELGFFVVVAVTLARLRSTTERWSVLARTDLLTGVYNRRAFLELAELELARAQRYQRFLSLAFLDIDDFKQVNDRGGHQEGDRLLARVADTLRRNVRAFDIVARFGGDEFVLLLPETNDEDWHVGFSIGAVTIEGPYATLDRLLQQADRLLYQAKHAGKGRLRHQHLRPNGAEGTPTPDVDFLRPVAYAPLSGGGHAGR